MVPRFNAAFLATGASASAEIARLDVTELGKLAPELLVCDIDRLEVDSLEMLRRIRFVLPDCLIAVYTGVAKRAWGVACHLAGANCVLLKDSDEGELSIGLRYVLQSGCYTDPRFAAA